LLRFGHSKKEIMLLEKNIELNKDLEKEKSLDEGGLYPYDPTSTDIDIREEPQTIYELIVRKYDQGKVIISPNFQRGFVWTKKQMSQFVESVLLNFPLPPLYINQDINGNYIVVDGRQRITTLRQFMSDDFKLQDLEALTNLNGKKFSELEGILQSKIEDKKLNLYLIKPSVPLEVVYDIFYRINTKGTSLTRQEIRNCIFLGKATELLSKLSEKDVFKKAIDNGISSKRMKDQEAVLRYLAFYIFDYQKDYKGNMSNFLEDTMRFINSKLSDDDIMLLESKFEKAMMLTFDFFGKQNFRYPTEKRRGNFNLAMFETVSYFFSIQSDNFLLENKEAIQHNFKVLLNDEIFKNASQRATGDKTRVITRFNRVQEILGDI
jgi:uncharacterized protein with ParB-like and HNH nuclease domain